MVQLLGHAYTAWVRPTPQNMQNVHPEPGLLQIGVLHWFARLWEIERSDYWGYITNCGTEGNLHGILVGRENLPDGVLYASRETHYSVFKAARMYRMDAVRVSPALYWLTALHELQGLPDCPARASLQVLDSW